MTADIPPRVAERIAELEQTIANTQAKIAQMRTTIDMYEKEVDDLTRILEAIRWTVGLSVNGNGAHMPLPGARPAAEPGEERLKERVLDAFAKLQGRVTAQRLAAELGEPDTRRIAPLIGTLHREKRIRPAGPPTSGARGWEIAPPPPPKDPEGEGNGGNPE